jgi:hypothetical protein
MRRAVAEVVEFVGISIKVKEVGTKVFIVDILPSCCPDHEGSRLVRS